MLRPHSWPLRHTDEGDVDAWRPLITLGEAAKPPAAASPVRVAEGNAYGFAAIALGLTLAGCWAVVVEKARGLTDAIGRPRAIALALLGLLALLVTTWKQIVQGLAIGLTGREGLIKSSVVVRLSSLVLIGLVFHFLGRSAEARIALFHAVPWIPAVPVLLKMSAAVLRWSAAAWIACRFHRDRLLGDRAVLAWNVDTPHVGHFFWPSWPFP